MQTPDYDLTELITGDETSSTISDEYSGDAASVSFERMKASSTYDIPHFHQAVNASGDYELVVNSQTSDTVCVSCQHMDAFTIDDVPNAERRVERC